ncbi:MAG: Gfo/Idh/MocA family oxidoreductase [Candidatus Omnitrophica bacterium]|nr:Gfo/Idh/MocA family oxidoreductase [Candidatus Omnitrophota bacterium]
MAKKLRVGIAGYGVVGKIRHRFIDQHPRLKTAAVCDKKMKGRGVMPGGIEYFKHYSELLKVPLDILFVSLPNYLASEVTIAGLKKGLHVFCEKPPGRTVSDIKNVIEVEKRYPDLKLKYGFNHRYHDSVKEAHRIIQSKILGQIVNMRGVYGKSKIIPFSGGWRSCRRFAGGGILLDQGIHMVDLMRFFCGEFVEVKSFISNGFWGHDVEDNAYAIMRDKKHRVAILHSTATQWQHRFMLDIALTKGALSLQGILSGSKSYGQERLYIIHRSGGNAGSQEEQIINYLDDTSWKDEVDEFADAVVNNRPVKTGTSHDALMTMKLVYKIYCADPRWKEKYKIKET